MAKFEKRRSEKNKGIISQPWYFVLKANNGEIILQSEMYVSEQGADNGIAAIKAAVIEIVDQECEDLINNAQFPNGV